MNKFTAGILVFLLSLGFSTPSFADTVIEKIVRTGKLTAGTRTDVVPLAYTDDKGNWIGYSVDLLNLIKAELETQLNRKIELELVPITPSDRIPNLLSGSVDIVCDSSNFTWDREKYIDFSISYGITGTKLLAKKGSNLGSPDSLKNKRIGYISDTVNKDVIKLVQPEAQFIALEDNNAGLKALEEGKIDAFAWDGLLLQALRVNSPNPDAWELTPAQPYATQGLACMLPEQNSAFRDLVNYTIVKFMQAYVEGKPEAVAIVDRWFGAEGTTPIDPELIQPFFENIIELHEQILLN